jgi:hypothetical protein
VAVVETLTTRDTRNTTLERIEIALGLGIPFSSIVADRSAAARESPHEPTSRRDPEVQGRETENVVGSASGAA